MKLYQYSVWFTYGDGMDHRNLWVIASNKGAALKAWQDYYADEFNDPAEATEEWYNDDHNGEWRMLDRGRMTGDPEPQCLGSDAIADMIKTVLASAVEPL